MTEQELQRLSRKDLLEMMIAQERELESLRAELKEAQTALKSREIAIDEAGSIAIAALQLNGIFEIAQASCQQYVENIKQLNQRQAAACAKREAQSKEKASRLLKEAVEKCRELEAETRRRCAQAEAECQKRCEEMEAEARKQSEAYWKEVSQRLQIFYESYKELKKPLTFSTED